MHAAATTMIARAHARAAAPTRSPIAHRLLTPDGILATRSSAAPFLTPPLTLCPHPTHRFHASPSRGGRPYTCAHVNICTCAHVHAYVSTPADVVACSLFAATIIISTGDTVLLPPIPTPDSISRSDLPPSHPATGLGKVPCSHELASWDPSAGLMGSRILDPAFGIAHAPQTRDPCPRIKPCTRGIPDRLVCGACHRAAWVSPRLPC